MGSNNVLQASKKHDEIRKIKIEIWYFRDRLYGFIQGVYGMKW